MIFSFGIQMALNGQGLIIRNGGSSALWSYVIL